MLSAPMGLEPNAIPGMIEPGEQDLLRDMALSLDLPDDEVVCEFGALFGRSTMALALGLLDGGVDPGRRDAPAPVTHDLLSFAKHGVLQDLVRRMAAGAGVGHLLAAADGRIDFLPVFDHYMRGLPGGLLARRVGRLADARHDGRTIAAMHIDAPKWYEEYMQLMHEFGTALKPGAQIVLQDFFYHWSATLIAMVQVMLDAGVVEPLETAASSLLVRTRRAVAPALLAELDARYQASDPLVLVRRAIATMQDFEVDRPAIFVGRLHLAGLQLARESGREDAGSFFLRGFEAGLADPAAAPALQGDWDDLQRHRFSLRRAYEADVDGA